MTNNLLLGGDQCKIPVAELSEFGTLHCCVQYPLLWLVIVVMIMSTLNIDKANQTDSRMVMVF